MISSLKKSLIFRRFTKRRFFKNGLFLHISVYNWCLSFFKDQIPIYRNTFFVSSFKTWHLTWLLVLKFMLNIMPMGYLKVYYFIRRKKNKQGKVPIYCRLQMNGKRKDFSIFKWIEMEKWDDKKQYPKTSYPELKRLYDYMKSIEHGLYDSELQC